ncbi:MAG: 50S ribosomal protein L2 [Verrucomicrobiota bacterium]
MAVKTFRPVTPTLRYKTSSDFAEITKSEPEKSLLQPKKRSGGRNNRGRKTARHRGGGHKRHYRIIDWKRNRHGETAKVIAIEYDPNRTANIALLEYPDTQRAYIVAPVGIKVGAKVVSGPDVKPDLGNSLPLNKIPLGQSIHNIELMPGRGAQIVRSAGSSATLMGYSGGYAQIKLPSGEIRRVHSTCYATIGQVGNTQHEKIKLGKAGRSRWLGRRPQTRAMVMNPVDHPMGGGEAKSKSGGGRKHPKSPWGQIAKGFRTRQKHKPSDKFIVERKNKK